ncbi:hypothetical protein C8F01DRAFT_743905 [Mycena amicta]|nr:hypothetical protein C8F01DRAFT_743905 [Mycena amicta]
MHPRCTLCKTMQGTLATAFRPPCTRNEKPIALDIRDQHARSTLGEEDLIQRRCPQANGRRRLWCQQLLNAVAGSSDVVADTRSMKIRVAGGGWTQIQRRVHLRLIPIFYSFNQGNSPQLPQVDRVPSGCKSPYSARYIGSVYGGYPDDKKNNKSGKLRLLYVRGDRAGRTSGRPLYAPSSSSLPR